MKLKKLFHALVLVGAAIGIAHCGGGTTGDPSGSGSTGGTSLLPDGGVADAGMGFPPGAPGGW
ncbi:MAG: hypothetical protein ACLQDQ_04815 [Myxococcaceae bacterium]